jgi:hypothetical protein
MELVKKLIHYLDEVRNATNFGLTYWSVILRAVEQFVQMGEVTWEQIGSSAEEVGRIRTALADIVPQT